MSHTSPAFQFYPDDFMGGKPALMEPAETHVYVWLLCLDWNQNGFVFDEKAIAKWCRISTRKLRAAWPRVRDCFVERDGRMYNPRLDKEREKQARWREKSAEGGRKGASTRLSRVVEPPLQPNGNIPFPIPTPIPKEIKASRAADAPEPARPSWPARLAGIWRAEVGRITPGRVGGQLAEYEKQYGADLLERAMTAFIAAKKSQHQPVRFAWFVSDVVVWVLKVQRPASELYDNGWFTEELERETRPAA